MLLCLLVGFVCFGLGCAAAGCLWGGRLLCLLDFYCLLCLLDCYCLCRLVDFCAVFSAACMFGALLCSWLPVLLDLVLL